MFTALIIISVLYTINIISLIAYCTIMTLEKEFELDEAISVFIFIANMPIFFVVRAISAIIKEVKKEKKIRTRR